MIGRERRTQKQRNGHRNREMNVERDKDGRASEKETVSLVFSYIQNIIILIYR